MANINSFSARGAWAAPQFRPAVEPQAGARPQPLSATAQLGTVARSRHGGMESTYSTRGADLNSFSIQSSNGRTANITGLGAIGDEVRLHYTVDGQESRTLSFNSGRLAERIQKRDEAIKNLYGKVSEFNADGVITPDEYRQFNRLSNDVRGLQARVMTGLGAALNRAQSPPQPAPPIRPAATPTAPIFVPEPPVPAAPGPLPTDKPAVDVLPAPTDRPKPFVEIKPMPAPPVVLTTDIPRPAVEIRPAPEILVPVPTDKPKPFVEIKPMPAPPVVLTADIPKPAVETKFETPPIRPEATPSGPFYVPEPVLNTDKPKPFVEIKPMPAPPVVLTTNIPRPAVETKFETPPIRPEIRPAIPTPGPVTAEPVLNTDRPKPFVEIKPMPAPPVVLTADIPRPVFQTKFETPPIRPEVRPEVRPEIRPAIPTPGPVIAEPVLNTDRPKPTVEVKPAEAPPVVLTDKPMPNAEVKFETPPIRPAAPDLGPVAVVEPALNTAAVTPDAEIKGAAEVKFETPPIMAPGGFASDS